MDRSYEVKKEEGIWLALLIEDGKCKGAWDFSTKRDAIKKTEALRETYEGTN